MSNENNCIRIFRFIRICIAAIFFFYKQYRFLVRDNDARNKITGIRVHIVRVIARTQKYNQIPRGKRVHNNHCCSLRGVVVETDFVRVSVRNNICTWKIIIKIKNTIHGFFFWYLIIARTASPPGGREYPGGSLSDRLYWTLTKSPLS